MQLIDGNKYIVLLECTIDNKVVEREVDIAWYMSGDFETVNDWDEGLGEWHVAGILELPAVDSDLWVPYKDNQ